MTQIKRVKVTVARDGHIHQGRECKKGDTIEVKSTSLPMLQKAGSIEKTAAKTGE